MRFRPALVLFMLITGACVQDARSEISLLAGGGWTAARGDSAAYTRRGLTGEGALELEVRPNLGILLGGAYTATGLHSSRLKTDLGFPSNDPLDGKTRIIDLTLAPKLYLLNHDIAAYFLIGGGPRWITHRATAPVTGVTSTRTEQAWGMAAGFGVDMDFDGFRIGFSPTYHRINEERRALEYVSFVFYLKL